MNDGGYWYAVGKIKGGGWGRTKAVRMHRLICGAARGEMVDHRDGDTLNNRRDNLRPATNAQNQANRASRCGTSRFKGASWNAEKGCWRASIYRGGKYRFLGYSPSEDAAADAYDAAAKEADGQFARLNLAG